MNQGRNALRVSTLEWSCVRGRADLAKLPLEGWTARRRGDLLKLLVEAVQTSFRLGEGFQKQPAPNVASAMKYPSGNRTP